jgi:hypothetical protein
MDQVVDGRVETLKIEVVLKINFGTFWHKILVEIDKFWHILVPPHDFGELEKIYKN